MPKVNYKKLSTDTVAFGLSSIASKVISYFLLPLYTAVLTTEEFGFADTMQTLVNLLYPLFTFAICEALLRFTIDDKDINKRSQYVTASAIIVFGSTLIIWAMQLIVNFSDSLLADHWIYVVLMYLGFNIERCTSYYTKAIGKTKLVAVAGVFNTSLLIGLNLLFLLVFKIGLMGYIWAIIISYYATSAFQIIAGRLWQNIRLCKVEKETFLAMIKYSAPMIVTIMAWWVNTTADKYIIEYALDIGKRGLYAAAYKIPTIISSLTTIFIDAWKLTMYDASKDQVDGSFSTVYKNLGMFSALVVTALIVFSQFLGGIMFAESYYVAWMCIPFLAAAVYYSTLSGYLASAITKEKSTGKLLVGTISGAIVNIALGILLVPKYGIVVAAFTTYLGFFVTWIIRLIQVTKIVKIELNVCQEIVNALSMLVTSVVMSVDMQYKYYVVIPVFLITILNNFGLIRDIVVKFFEIINHRKQKAS